MSDTHPDRHLSAAGWTTLYHPRGPRCTLPLSCDPAEALAQVSRALDVGWLVNAPGLEDGEEKELIGWVLRLDHEKDGETTPTVLLYSANPALTYSYLRKYLNTDEDVAAFEHASKLRLDDLPVYPGNDHPQRGASGKSDKFIVAAAKPFGVVWKPNPKYREAPPGNDNRSIGEKRKRDFVRWENQIPLAQAAPAQAEAPAGPAAAETRHHVAQETQHGPAAAPAQPNGQAGGAKHYPSWQAFVKDAHARAQNAVRQGYVAAVNWLDALQARTKQAGFGPLDDGLHEQTINQWCAPQLQKFFAEVSAGGNKPVAADAAVDLLAALRAARMSLQDAARRAGVELRDRKNASDLTVREAELVRRAAQPQAQAG